MPASDNTAVISALAARGEPDPTAALRARVVALTRYGLERQAGGDIQAAVEAFRGVTDLMPGLPLGWNNLALALSTLGDHEAALPALRCAVALGPDAPGVWTSLANTFLHLERYEEADSACGEALGRDRLDASAWQIRATACAGRNDFDAAAEAFGRTLDIAGETAPLRASRGAMLFRGARFAEAATELDAALALDPTADATLEMAELCRFVLAALDGDMAAACAAGGVAAATPGPGMDRLFKTALLYLDAAGHDAAARRVGEHWAALRPAELEARHFRDATAAEPVDRPPAELVAAHFDGVADDFEDRVERLDYDGPTRIAALISAHLTADATLEVLDAGCGTGLCGPALRPYARRLAGVDLSAGMLAKARARDLYDELEAADLVAVLERPGAAWDLVLAADTFPYLGRLEPVFAAAAKALKPGGLFAFSTETWDGREAVLRGNGRYAHGAGYIAGLCPGRFELVEHLRTTLRREAGQPVVGDYFLLCKLDA
jgi:predicted TPR repeat methyltransferase